MPIRNGGALERPVSVFAQLMLDTYVRPVRLRGANPCAQSRSTVHPEHNRATSATPSKHQSVLGHSQNIEINGDEMANTSKQNKQMENGMIERHFLDAVYNSTRRICDTTSK